MDDVVRVWRCGEHALALDRTLVMGVVNVTPDSFADGGRFETVQDAVAWGADLAAEGADIVDVGGESTRPGADEVNVEEELDRVLPVVRGIAATGVPVSIDTRHSRVARECLKAGACVLNDVSGFRDPAMVGVATASDCGCVIMHMKGEPRTMQTEPPVYDDVVAQIADYLASQARMLEDAGVASERIAIDPGIGFGKTVEHNLEIVRRLSEFAVLGYPVFIGASRKSFIGAVLGIEDPSDRVEGSLAIAAWAAGNGASIVRVHDVRETVRSVRMIDAVTGRPQEPRA